MSWGERRKMIHKQSQNLHPNFPGMQLKKLYSPMDECHFFFKTSCFLDKNPEVCIRFQKLLL